MATMQWEAALSVGVDLIDEQHKKWIGGLNDVATAVEARRGPTEVSRALEFLVDYTQSHFSTEEKLMVESSYPGLDEHRAKHAELRETLQELVKDFDEEGANAKLADAVRSFLSNWLVKHIRDVDTRLGAFVRQKGLTPRG